jgi:hypothetical protein
VTDCREKLRSNADVVDWSVAGRGCQVAVDVVFRDNPTGVKWTEARWGVVVVAVR